MATRDATRDACKRSLQAMAADDALAQSKALLLEKGSLFEFLLELLI